MTRDETKKIIIMLSSTYPNWHPSDMSLTVDAWTLMLEDFSYNQVAAALKAFLLSDTGGFAPSVGQLIGMMDRLGSGEELSEMEAWSLVSKALRRSIYYADSEYDKLPEVVKKAIGSPEMLRSWAETDMKSIENVVQSNFMRTYRQELARAKEMRKIPASVRALLEGNSSKSLLEKQAQAEQEVFFMRDTGRSE